MQSKKALLVGTAGLGLVAALAVSGAAAAAPGNPWDEVAAILRGVLTVEVVNSEPIAVTPVTTAVVADEPIVLSLEPDADFYVVPEGKLLVIQAVSVDVNEEAYNSEPDHSPTFSLAVSDFDADDLQFFFFPLQRTTQKWATHAQTTIYATAGKSVGSVLTPEAPSLSRLTISGILRDAP